MDTETNALSTLANLLKQKSPSLASLTYSEEAHEPDPDISENFATILDLGRSDRYRVLKLIEELLDTQEEVDQLKQTLSEEKLEFREKRSSLLKKLDALNEKYERALKDIKILKERHSHSLRKLEEKISTVSSKFEASIDEITELRKENAELKRDNMTLRKLNCESTATVSIIQGENSRLSTKLELSKHTEKTLKKQLKRFASEVSFYPESAHNSYNVSRSSSALLMKHTEDNRPRPQKENESEERLCAGAAGDCGDFLPSASFCHGLNTIKAPPAKADSLQQNHHPSTFAFPNNNYKIDSVPPENKTYSLEDAAILENLFFRF